MDQALTYFHIENILEKSSHKHTCSINKSYEIMIGNKTVCVKYIENKWEGLPVFH